LFQLLLILNRPIASTDIGSTGMGGVGNGRALRSATDYWLDYQWQGLVELRGIEPLTSAVRLQRSPI
jgi:hypothetical protein